MVGVELGLRARSLTYVAHVLEAAAAVMVLIWCISFRGGLAFESSDKSLIFNIHPVLMLIGFVILASEAIMSYKSLPFSKQVNKLIHLSLHAIALVLGIIGIYAAFKFHNESGIDNLYSLHSWVGLGTICLYGVQWIYGFLTFFYPGGAPTLRRASLPWHIVVGLIIYGLAIATAAMGFLEKLTFLQSSSGVGKYSSEAFLVNFNALAVILFGVFVVLAAVSPVDQHHPPGYAEIPSF